ncbi:MAG: hypothetical protein ALECFALPRED_001439 [Alectoria fallacina]|uniref:O-methyltransferase n=1 Tax=Alectoria fallacina TaxID=1903189 RepID=A0A8H3PLJ0_9LECA|nr:MAG: hypothetical protein ALECFALPRED_001439 [Alectoria fallacina]
MASLTALAEDALKQAKLLDAYVAAQGRPNTSFNGDTLTNLPPDLVEAREALVNSTQTLKRLALGPVGVLTEIMWAFSDEISLGAINDFSLADCVPLDGSATLAQIAAKSGLSERLVERFMRHAMGNHIFTENPPGQVRHTASSRLLATDPYLKDTIAMMVKEIWHPSTRVIDAVRQFHDSDEPTEAPFTLVNEPGVGMFEFLTKHPERARKFGGAMKWYGSFESWDLKHLVNGYSWDLIDRPGALFVDVGGGQGAVPKALGPATRDLKFVVQDMESTVADGERLLPEELKGRVEFMRHDFFTEQPVRGADVYFLRWILHDWSDKYAIRILKALVPAMRDGSKVVLFEWLLKDGPETDWTEKYPRNVDLAMLAQFNSNERTATAFKNVFHQADPRFQVVDIKKPRGSAMAIIEVVWRSGVGD